MNEREKTAALTAQTERLRIQFLDRELDLTETLIELVQMERNHGNSAHVSEGIEHATRGVQTVRKFIALIASPSERNRILTRLEKNRGSTSQMPTTSKRHHASLRRTLFVLP